MGKTNWVLKLRINIIKLLKFYSEGDGSFFSKKEKKADVLVVFLTLSWERMIVRILN